MNTWYNDATTNFKTFRRDEPMETKAKYSIVGGQAVEPLEGQPVYELKTVKSELKRRSL